MMWFCWSRPVRHPVGQKITVDGLDGREFCVIDLGRDVSRELRLQIDGNILGHGRPFNTGGVLNTAFLPILGGGSTIASSLLAGNLFLATANPASLMQIGTGVGSAVIGAGGKIVATAPFVAAGAAIIPVVAPVVLFMTISTMVICARLDRIQNSLNQIGDVVEQLLVQEIAEDGAILVTSINRLRDISDEYDACGRFTEEMRIRLALAERDLNVLHHKYETLSRHAVAKLEAVGEVSAPGLEASRMMLFAMAGLADIEVDRLRLKLALQESPDDLGRRVSMRESKSVKFRESSEFLLANNPVAKYLKQLEKAGEGMGAIKKMVFAKKFEALMTETKETTEKVEQIKEMLRSASANAADQEHSVVFYREHGGKGDLKAYYTTDWQLGSLEPSPDATP